MRLAPPVRWLVLLLDTPSTPDTGSQARTFPLTLSKIYVLFVLGGVDENG